MPLTVFLTRIQDSNAQFNVRPHKIMSELFFFPTMLKTNELNAMERLFNSHQWGRGHGRRSKRSNFAETSRCSSWCWILIFTTMYQKKKIKKKKNHEFTLSPSPTQGNTHWIHLTKPGYFVNKSVAKMCYLIPWSEFCCALIGRLGSKMTQHQQHQEMLQHAKFWITTILKPHIDVTAALPGSSSQPYPLPLVLKPPPSPFSWHPSTPPSLRPQLSKRPLHSITLPRLHLLLFAVILNYALKAERLL